MPPKIHAKIQFMSKYRMLTDFASTISEAQGTSAVAVAKRNFGSYYNQFVLAYEALLGLSSEEIPEGEMEQIHAQFSEINKLLVKLEQASEGRGSADEPRIPHHSQKLPTLIRSAFEQRYGTCHQVLPSVHQLLEVLDEQCRVQLAVSPTPEAASGRSYHRPPPRRGQQGASTSGARGRPARGVHPVHQVNPISSCSFCGGDHSLYKCVDFLSMSPVARKSWAKKSGHCFKCLRLHYAKECSHTNWCLHCKSPDHNSLICNAAASSRAQVSPDHSQPGASTSGQGRQIPRRQSPVRQYQHVAQVQVGSQGGHPVAQVTHSPQWSGSQGGQSNVPVTQPLYQEAPSAQALASHRPRLPVGARAQWAQSEYQALRYGQRISPIPPQSPPSPQ
ncbi:uncharacterized protein [Choristoneura fumiferana]|uniref:uncharacterized protein n=1 Tax=Choristoneura fumiferana TaxID=7141 RepID=UPI003D15C87A